jgi:hypothetical protein
MSFTDFTPRSLVFEFYLQISLGPPILNINPSALQIAYSIHQSPGNFLKKPIEPSKFIYIAPEASKLHNFSTVTPNQVILVPMLMIVAFM